MSRRAIVVRVVAVVFAALVTVGVVLCFGLVAEAGAARCAGGAGRWFGFARPVLLWFAGVPIVLGVMLLGPGGLFAPGATGQRVLIGAFVVAVFAALTVGVPYFAVAGVCVQGGGVSVARLASTEDLSVRELQGMRTSRLDDDRVLVLVGQGREIAVPLSRAFGLGRAGDPDALELALVAFSERAGLTMDESRRREMQRQRELVRELAAPP